MPRNQSEQAPHPELGTVIHERKRLYHEVAYLEKVMGMKNRAPGVSHDAVRKAKDEAQRAWMQSMRAMKRSGLDMDYWEIDDGIADALVDYYANAARKKYAHFEVTPDGS